MVETFDTEENFWDLYPEFKIALSFKELYNRDKTKDKNRTSKMMWFIALTRDPNSKFYNLPQSEKESIIGEDYMGDIKYFDKNQKELSPLIEDYYKLAISPAKRHLIDWDIKINERSEFIKQVPYTLDTFEDLDKMVSQTAKIYDNLTKIRDNLSKEEGEGNVKGGGVASLND